MKTIRQLLESFRFAWQALRSNLLRTALSLLGVTIGIFAIIAVFTMVDSLQSGVVNSLNFLGSNVIYVQKWPFTPEDGDDEYPWWKYFQRPEPTYAEYKLLAERLENAQAVAATDGRGGVTFKRNSNSMAGRISGVTYEFNQITDIPVAEGRYFSQQEMDGARNVAVIGSEVAETLFPDEEAVGKTFKMAGLNFQVIGVQEKKGAGLFDIGGQPDKRCVIPFSTFSKLFQRQNPSITIAIKGYASDEGLQALEGETKGLLRARRSLKPIQDDSFSLNRPEAIVKAIGGIFKVLTVAGWVIGSFSILVGGFGIANIMFVSVKERTNLIGIQKSLGAKNYFILFQFLFEAVLLSLVGGLVGVGLVYLLSLLPFGSLEVTLTAGNMLLGLGVSSVIGIISGILPALSAARLDPVIAIRAK